MYTYRWNIFPQPLKCLFAQFIAKQIELFHVYIYVEWQEEEYNIYIYLRLWPMGVQNEME